MPEQRTTSKPAPPKTDRSLAPNPGLPLLHLRDRGRDCPCATARRHHTAAQHRRASARVRGHHGVRRPPRSTTRRLGGVGFHPRRGRGLLIAVVGPVLIGALSFGVAAAFGVVRFPGLGAISVSGGLNILVGLVISTFVFLGEEIGWRGYLLFRLAEVTSGRMAAVLTGAFHAIFHLPLLLLTTTYQSAVNAGSWYRW